MSNQENSITYTKTPSINSNWIKTCKVILKNGDSAYDYYGYQATVFSNNKLTTVNAMGKENLGPCDVTIDNIVCGSQLVLGMKGEKNATFFAIDGEAELVYYGGTEEPFPSTHLFTIGETDEEVTIYLYGAKA